jgi:hypothetical protein
MICCREVVESLFDFVSGELPLELCQRIEGHLKVCSHCVCIVETYQVTIKLSRQLPKNDSLPRSCAQRLRTTIERAMKAGG